jgi:hypothetical protein
VNQWFAVQKTIQKAIRTLVLAYPMVPYAAIRSEERPMRETVIDQLEFCLTDETIGPDFHGYFVETLLRERQ